MHLVLISKIAAVILLSERTLKKKQKNPKSQYKNSAAQKKLITVWKVRSGFQICLCHLLAMWPGEATEHSLSFISHFFCLVFLRIK